MTVNRSNISTSADGADIFTIGAADSPFINLGNLTTSGNRADAIRIAASGDTVNNLGQITTTGDGAVGILSGEIFGTRADAVTIRNFGSIHTSGSFFDQDFSDGIDVFGNNADVANYGIITIDDPNPVGIYSIGADSKITNYGLIESAGFAGVAIDTVDGTGGEIHNLVVNRGEIHSTADGAYGILLTIGDNVVENHGLIQVDGAVSFGIAMSGDRNHGENTGTILATGDHGRGVLLEGEHLTFDNYGTIRTTGTASIGVRFSAENLLGTDGGTFTNYGSVVSAGRAVSSVDSSDHVINRGSLIGNVTLGAGDDSYTAGKGGSLSGTLTLGDGNDLVIFEKGGGSLTVTDFVAGAGSVDVIDLSALGYSSFANVMNHASQSGADVVLNFGGKDQIVLQNVTLGSLAPDDFALTASSSITTPSAPAALSAHADWASLSEASMHAHHGDWIVA